MPLRCSKSTMLDLQSPALLIPAPAARLLQATLAQASTCIYMQAYCNLVTATRTDTIMHNAPDSAMASMIRSRMSLRPCSGLYVPALRACHLRRNMLIRYAFNCAMRLRNLQGRSNTPHSEIYHRHSLPQTFTHACVDECKLHDSWS